MSKPIHRIAAILLIPTLIVDSAFGQLRVQISESRNDSMVYACGSGLFAQQALAAPLTGAFRREGDLPAILLSQEASAKLRSSKNENLIEIVAANLHKVGGLQQYLWSVNEKLLAGEPRRIHLLYLVDEDPNVYSEKVGNGTLIHHPFLAHENWRWTRRMLVLAWDFFRATLQIRQQERADGSSLNLLHLHGTSHQGILMGFWLAGAGRRVTRIVTVHMADPSWRHYSVKYLIAKLTAIFWVYGAHVFGVSRASVKGFLGRTSVIGSGVDTEFYSKANGHGDAFRRRLGLASADPILFYPARIEPFKGQADLLILAEKLQAIGMKARIVIMGDTQDPAYLKQLHQDIQTRQLSDRIRIFPAGTSEDVRDGYAASDVVVFPSRMEGLGLIALEAGAMEVPVVAYKVGGLAECVQNGRTGYLVSPDDVEQFYKRVLELLQNPQHRAVLGASARDFIQQHYSIDSLVERHAALYAWLAHWRFCVLWDFPRMLIGGFLAVGILGMATMTRLMVRLLGQESNRFVSRFMPNPPVDANLVSDPAVSRRRIRKLLGWSLIGAVLIPLSLGLLNRQAMALGGMPQAAPTGRSSSSSSEPERESARHFTPVQIIQKLEEATVNVDRMRKALESEVDQLMKGQKKFIDPGLPKEIRRAFFVFLVRSPHPDSSRAGQLGKMAEEMIKAAKDLQSIAAESYKIISHGNQVNAQQPDQIPDFENVGRRYNQEIKVAEASYEAVAKLILPMKWKGLPKPIYFAETKDWVATIRVAGPKLETGEYLFSLTKYRRRGSKGFEQVGAEQFGTMTSDGQLVEYPAPNQTKSGAGLKAPLHYPTTLRAA